MATVKTLDTEVELLKREVTEMKQIHLRLDSAIEKIADVSSALHTIMAVHEEKLIRQEEALDEQEKNSRIPYKNYIAELHPMLKKLLIKWVKWNAVWLTLCVNMDTTRRNSSSNCVKNYPQE
jgi:hypothetical protein